MGLLPIPFVGTATARNEHRKVYKVERQRRKRAARGRRDEAGREDCNSEATKEDSKMPSCVPPFHQDVGKGGLSLKGVAFMTVLVVLAVLESTLPSCCLAYKIQYQEGSVTGLAVSAVVAVPVVTATPLKLNPPFPADPDFKSDGPWYSARKDT